VTEEAGVAHATHVAIAGAGIGGLTAALTLHARGFGVTVFEQATQVRALGLGINLLPHAVRELYALGLGAELEQIAVVPHSIGFYDAGGELLFREPRGIDGGYGYPQFSVHRGWLQLLLLHAVRERLGADAVRTASAVVGFTEAAARVHVQVRGSGAPILTDVLVGADGLHSAVRAQLHPHDTVQWSGVRMWRGATRMRPFLDGRTMAVIKGNNGVDLVTYPIGPRLVNWVLQVREGPAGPLSGDARWNAPGDPADVLRHTAHWRPGWLDVAELVGGAASIFEYPMVDRDPLATWGRGRVTLLGDAAHPMYPVGSNGGSQAIVDAVALADHLSVDLVHGLRRYEDERLPATADIVGANRVMHRAGAKDPTQLAAVTGRYRRQTLADHCRGA
jgi:2-polyprenyl-6-methoxyphenol hydroxylase-like FAD-dependent oxidoreductase